jgi:polyhydroxyalkanoate synthesis regulator phasin
VRRIGVLSIGSAATVRHLVDAFVNGMADLGYHESRNVHYEVRYGEGSVEKFEQYAREHVETKVDLIWTSGTPATTAAQKATTSIPIVFAVVGDPVYSKLIKSLAFPGANLNGMSAMTSDTWEKRRCSTGRCKIGGRRGRSCCRAGAKPGTLRPAAAKEHHMPEPNTSAAGAAPTMTEDQPIRERVKELTSQVLQQGRIDPEAVRDVVSAVIGRASGSTEASGAKAREFFADAVRQLDDALVKSATAAHGALQKLAARGQDFSDNDLKEALASLRKLEEDYVAVASRLAEAMSANLRREMTELTAHAQNLGVEASVRVASMMGEFANSMGAAGSGLATVRGASARMAMLASGVLAGVADALRDQSEAKKGK